MERILDRASTLFAILARRRAAGVGLALGVEVALLTALAYADPASVGLAGGVVAAIAGTVAVVFGPVDGALVALAGAFVFVVADGSGARDLAALAVWPAAVAAAGLFARRVGEQRAALGRVLAAQELERKRLALELHDDAAQSLAGALLLLRRAELATAPGEAESVSAEARDAIAATIRSVRRLAVDLRPRALDDFGLVPAVERLAATFSDQTGIDVAVVADADAERLPPEAELVLYRAAQEALANVGKHAGAQSVRLVLERTGRSAAVVVEDDGRGFGGATDGGEGLGLSTLRERVRLVGGRLTVRARPGSGTILRAEIPTNPS